MDFVSSLELSYEKNIGIEQSTHPRSLASASLECVLANILLKICRNKLYPSTKFLSLEMTFIYSNG